MKHIIKIAFLLAVSLPIGGCKKYLNVDPPNSLSGNNFWETKKDVEAYTNGMYELLRKSVTRPDLTVDGGIGNFPFFIFGGDFRGAPVKIASTLWGRTYITDMANNNIRSLMSTQNDWYGIWNMPRFTQWDKFFKVIASANIAYEKIDDVEDPLLSDADRKRFKAEAVFLRNFCYFLMVRQWGDVPYYTEAYYSKPLKRTPMVEVLQNCAADLDAVHKDLPWTYEDPVFVAVRAMRGSGLALLMHINMWLASFDGPNADKYYEAVDKYGDELLNENGGAYELLPLERTGEIFKGRSKEGLFEIPQNKNYNESFGWSTYYDHVKFDDKRPDSYPYICYEPDFMKAIFPEGESDNRIQFWYDRKDRYSMYSGSVKFRMTKFLISTDPAALDGFGFDASQTVFRLSDAILLQAEALAEMGQIDKAKQQVNIVRTRAGAASLNTRDIRELKEQIFYERCRELMGEAHYWYDVVRTRRIIDINYKFGYHCTVDQYKAGCWMWPLDMAVLKNNPGMTLNSYWQ